MCEAADKPRECCLGGAAVPICQQALSAVSDAGPSNLNMEESVSEVRSGDSDLLHTSIKSLLTQSVMLLAVIHCLTYM